MIWDNRNDTRYRQCGETNQLINDWCCKLWYQNLTADIDTNTEISNLKSKRVALYSYWHALQNWEKHRTQNLRLIVAITLIMYFVLQLGRQRSMDNLKSTYSSRSSWWQWQLTWEDTTVLKNNNSVRRTQVKNRVLSRELGLILFNYFSKVFLS